MSLVLAALPSLERPFGIRLWPLADAFARLVSANAFSLDAFEFRVGSTPLLTLAPVLKMISLYYALVFGGNYLLRHVLRAKPLVLNGLFQVHNLFLTLLSLSLLLLLVEQLLPIIVNHGLLYAICDPAAWTPPLVTIYYLNYLTKFVEFIDTLFLVVKQKRLTLLHTYHHGATALLCYTQLTGLTPISWVPISLNLGVHVVMYWYYFLAARGIRVWWKEWVTRFQIIQFVLDLAFVYYATSLKLVSTFLPKFAHWGPFCGDCAGTMYAAVNGCLILSSYLVLFIAFYIDVYKRKLSRKSRRVKSILGGVAAQVNEYVHSLGSSRASPDADLRSRK